MGGGVTSSDRICIFWALSLGVTWRRNTGEHRGEVGRVTRELSAPRRDKEGFKDSPCSTSTLKPSLLSNYLLPLTHPWNPLSRSLLWWLQTTEATFQLFVSSFWRPPPQETLPGPHLCESTALDSWFKGQSILPKTQEPVWFDSPLCNHPLDTAHSRCSINVYLKDGACPFLPSFAPLPPCLSTSDLTNGCFVLANILSIWCAKSFLAHVLISPSWPSCDTRAV